MTHYVNWNPKNCHFQYPRRNNGNLYESRTVWGPDLSQARVFNTKGAAKNSKNQSGAFLCEVVEVDLITGESVI